MFYDKAYKHIVPQDNETIATPCQRKIISRGYLIMVEAEKNGRNQVLTCVSDILKK